MNEKITMGVKTVSRIAAPMQMPKLKRVAAYARVSMGKDAMLHSLAAQVSYYSDLIQRNPEWEYAGVYADGSVLKVAGIQIIKSNNLNIVNSWIK